MTVDVRACDNRGPLRSGFFLLCTSKEGWVHHQSCACQLTHNTRASRGHSRPPPLSPVRHRCAQIASEHVISLMKSDNTHRAWIRGKRASGLRVGLLCDAVRGDALCAKCPQKVKSHVCCGDHWWLNVKSWYLIALCGLATIPTTFSIQPL